MPLNNWRIYRLPGSRDVWHIDTGCGTQVFNVRGYKAEHSYSKDIGGDSVPRAWIQIDGQELHIVNGFAVFTFETVKASEVISEAIECLRKDGL